MIDVIDVETGLRKQLHPIDAREQYMLGQIKYIDERTKPDFVKELEKTGTQVVEDEITPDTAFKNLRRKKKLEVKEETKEEENAD